MTSLFRKSSSKTGFMGFSDTEEIEGVNSSPTKKGYFGFGNNSTNFLEFEKGTQMKQCDNKQEQEQEKDGEQESVWNQSPSGFKYRVSNTRKQQGQNFEQNCLQSSSQSLAFALSPIAKDPRKLWSWRKKKKGTALFDDDSHVVEKAGISFFTSNRYQAMPKLQKEDNFGGFDVDSTRSPTTNLLTRLKIKAKRINKANWDPFSDVKELTKGVKEVVLEEDESEDTEDSQNSSSSSDSSSSEDS